MNPGLSVLEAVLPHLHLPHDESWPCPGSDSGGGLVKKELARTGAGSRILTGSWGPLPHSSSREMNVLWSSQWSWSRVGRGMRVTSNLTPPSPTEMPGEVLGPHSQRPQHLRCSQAVGSLGDLSHELKWVGSVSSAPPATGPGDTLSPQSQHLRLETTV